MYKSSLDAIRSKLAAAFETGPIYVNNVPDDFKRPSFFVQLASGTGDDLTFTKYDSRAVWQIVYFPPKDKAGNVDNFDLYQAADKIRAAFNASPALAAPDGAIYHVTNIEGGPRGEEIYIRVTLETQGHRECPTYDVMTDIKITGV